MDNFWIKKSAYSRVRTVHLIERKTFYRSSMCASSFKFAQLFLTGVTYAFVHLVSISPTAFAYKSVFEAFMCLQFGFVKIWWKELVQKLLVKCWRNWLKTNKNYEYSNSKKSIVTKKPQTNQICIWKCITKDHNCNQTRPHTRQ